MRNALLVVALLVPSVAYAVPVTFTFSAGDVSGWYTFDTNAIGVASIVEDDYFGTGTVHNGFTYTGAVSAFEVFVGSTRVMANAGGDISIGIRRTIFADSWYNAYFTDGPDFALGLSLWSPHDTIVDSESLTDVPPRFGGDIYGGLTLLDERHINVARDEPLSSFAVRHDDVSTLSAPTPTRVPEPSTLVMLLTGFIAVAAKAWT